MTEQEIANAVWKIKEIIRDRVNDKNVDKVILPFMVLRRLDCVLEDKYEAILEELSKTDERNRPIKLKVLMNKANLTFFNSSGLSLKKILSEPARIEDNFKTYLSGFSDNVKDILLHFVATTNDDDVDVTKDYDVTDVYKSIGSSLYGVTEAFVKLDLHPEKFSNAQIGTAFEIVIQYAKESTNDDAGQFFTPREVVRLLTSLVLSGQEKELNKHGKIFSVYDPCCGTGGMLTEAKRQIEKLANNPNVDVNLYGQEMSDQTYAIAKADMLMKGDLIDNERQIRLGDTLVKDKIPRSFEYMLANPPFGTDWSGDTHGESKIRKEYESQNGRFNAGLPSTSDGSLLFLQHMISKMDVKGSRIGIVLNGSPLFNGDAGGGWSNIRKSFLDRNLLDCIVALPKNLFYGTDITTYLWILDNKRPESKRNKVLFIDASDKDTFAKLLQRNIGKKRYEISDSGIKKVLDIYKDYKSVKLTINGEKVDVAKLMDYDDFFYTKVTVCRPLKLRFEDFQTKLCEQWDDLPAGARKNLEQFKDKSELNGTYADADFFAKLAELTGKKVSAALAKDVRRLASIDEESPAVYATPGKPETGYVANTDLNDTESIPKKQDIDEYFAREVLPFVPDAWMDRTKDKIGVEFPFTKLFYVYKPLRSNEEIFADLKALEAEADADFAELMKEDAE